jgi:cell division protein FtsL
MPDRPRWRWLAGIAVLVVSALLLVDPVRGLFAQRTQLDQLQARVTQLSAENRQLAGQAARLSNPANLGRLARQEFSMIKPGQQEYVVLPGPPSSP